MLNLKEKKKDEGTAKMGTDFNVVSILKVQSWIQARDRWDPPQTDAEAKQEHKPCSLKHGF